MNDFTVTHLSSGDFEVHPTQGVIEMKTLRIDDKWSVEYDPDNNDRPGRVLRYGELTEIDISHNQLNVVVAMFYALLEERRSIEPIPAGHVM